MRDLETVRTGLGRRFIALGLAVLLASLAGSTSCSTNPVSGRREVILMSEEREKEIDEQQARIVKEQIGLVEEGALPKYLDEIGQTLAANSPRPDIDFHFNIVQDDTPNAFALPGGHVYVTRGLLAFSNSEAEIANVLGHEIGHVAARHAAQRQVRAQTIGILSVLATVGAVVSGAGGAELVGIGTLGQGLLAAYGRDQEREADRIGQDLAVQAGINPLGMSEFLRTLDKTTRLTQGFSRAPGFLDTHPATPGRVAENITAAQARRWEADFEIAGSRREYLAMLDGLAVGPPAAEGVFHGDRFLHADFGVSLRFPHGWRRANQRTRVIAGAPDGRAIAVLELQGPGDDPLEAAHHYAAREGAEVQAGQSVRLGNLRAYRARAYLPTPQGEVDAEITWVAFGGQIFRLSGAALPGAFPRHEGVFRSFSRSFREIRDEERDLVHELRIRIVEAAAGERLADLSERSGNEWDLNTLAVANGILPDAVLEEGFAIKIANKEPYRAGPKSPEAGELAEARVPGSDGEESEVSRPAADDGPPAQAVPARSHL